MDRSIAASDINECMPRNHIEGTILKLEQLNEEAIEIRNKLHLCAKAGTVPQRFNPNEYYPFSLLLTIAE